MRDWPPKVVSRYQRAVFLDRDGTINVDTHHPHSVGSLEFIPRAIEGLVLLAQLPVSIIVVSNQAGIELGLFSEGDMSRFNTALRRQVEDAGGRIDAFYYCPHLEAKDLPPGKTPCKFSKPSPGMLCQAASDFKLDLRGCFMIGDRSSDIAAGARVGCVTILVETGNAGREEGALSIDPQHRAGDLLVASVIVQSHLGDVPDVLR